LLLRAALLFGRQRLRRLQLVFLPSHALVDHHLAQIDQRTRSVADPKPFDIRQVQQPLRFEQLTFIEQPFLAAPKQCPLLGRGLKTAACCLRGGVRFAPLPA
jgi:hypothetical protein